MKVTVSRKWENTFHWLFGPNSWWAKIGLPPYIKPKRVTVTICHDTEQLARDTCISTGPKEYLKGEEPTEMCSLHEKFMIAICPFSKQRINEWCPDIEQKSFYKWEIPDKICELHKAPEYVVVDVCADTNLLGTEWCPLTIEKQFEKGKEPTQFCQLHKPKPKPERTHMPAQVELYALTLDYMLKKTEGYVMDGVKIDRDTFWSRQFKRLHDMDIERVCVFPYAIEDGGIFNHLTPWVNTTGHREHGPWALDRMNETWWDETKKIKTVAAEEGVQIIDVYFPGAYGERPYRKNTNRVPDEWSDQAKVFQKAFMERLARLNKDVLAQTNWKDEIWGRLSNEVSHGGDWDFGKRIARRHRFWWESINFAIVLDRLINDSSHSDFVLPDLIELNDIPKGSGDWFGDDSFKRRHWPELHSMSPRRLIEPPEWLSISDFIPRMRAVDKDDPEREKVLKAANSLEAWAQQYGEMGTIIRWHVMERFPPDVQEVMPKFSLWNSVLNGGCGWRHWVLSSDGCDSGSGHAIPGTGFKGMTRKELGSLCKTAWTSILGPHSIIVADLPFEVFERRPGDGFLIENFTKIPFDKLSVMQEVWKTIRK